MARMSALQQALSAGAQASSSYTRLIQQQPQPFNPLGSYNMILQGLSGIKGFGGPAIKGGDGGQLAGAGSK